MDPCDENYDRRDGTNAYHGHDFELNLTCLTYVRCLSLFKEKKLESFKIASNMDQVGAFDDVVCRIVYKESGILKTKVIFIQTKHLDKTEAQELSDESFIPSKKPKREFETKNYDELIKYIKSYVQARKIFNENEDWTKFKNKNEKEGEKKKDIVSCRENMRRHLDCNLEDSLFIYYTNAEVHGITNYVPTEDPDQIKIIIDTSSNTGIYKMKIDSKTLETIVSTKYKGLTQEEKNRVSQFKDQFRLYINQEKQYKLEKYIEEALKLYFDKRNIDIKHFIKLLREEIKKFFQDKHGPFLTEKNSLLEKIFSLLELQAHALVEFKDYHKWSKLFSDNTVKKLHDELINNNSIYIDFTVMKRPIIIVKIIQTADKIKEKHVDMLLIYVKSMHCFECWKKIRNLHNYKAYSKVLLVLESVAIAEVQNLQSILNKEREYIISISETKNVVETSLTMQLSTTGKTSFLDYSNFEFQDRHATLREIFMETDLNNIFNNIDYQNGLESLLSSMLNNKKLKIGSSLPVEEKIYIERRYKKNAILLPYSAKLISNDIFIIYPKHIVPNSLILENVKEFDDEDEARKHFNSLQNIDQNVHLFLAKDSGMEVIYSKGTFEMKYETRQEILSEEDFLKHTLINKYTVISDDVGMGKSTAIRHLAHCIKEERKEYWVEFIDLYSLSDSLNNVCQYTNPIEFIATDMLKLSAENKLVFDHKCNADGNVALLFDGFDEMSKEYRVIFLHLITALSFTNIKTFVLSTRTVDADEVKNYFKVYTFSLLGFNYDEMSEYLIKFWSNNGCEEQHENLKQLVSKIVDLVKANKETLSAVATVPLQTKMLALIYSDEIRNALITGNLATFDLNSLNLYSLYEKYIEMHINRLLEEKLKMQKSKKEYNIFKKIYSNEELKNWEALACKEIFPLKDMSDGTTTYTDYENIQQIGIVLNLDPIKFVHRSFAEFLAAKHVSRLLYKSRNTELLHFIYQTICVDNTFAVLRKFMNAIYENDNDWKTAEINFLPNLVVNNNVLFVTVEEGNEYLFKAIFRHLNKNENVLNNVLNQEYLGVTLLHFSAMYCEQVFDDILNSNFFHRAKDLSSFAKYTAFHVACKYGKEKAVESYLNKFQIETHSTLLNEIVYDYCTPLTPLLMAAYRGHSNVIKILQRCGISIHNKNRFGTNALMLASSNGHVETVKYLLQQGAHINDTDIDGCTALLMACISIKNFEHSQTSRSLYEAHEIFTEKCERNEGWFEVVKYLVEQAGADVNKKDNEGKTALIHLAERDRDFNILKWLIQHGADIKAVDLKGRTAFMIAAMHGAKEIVKHFFELGEDVASQVDLNGNTCLILRSGYLEDDDGDLMLQYLLGIGSNLNHQNNNGDTALIKSLSFTKFETAIILIKHGADVNIFNKKGNSALIVASKSDFKFDRKLTEIHAYLLEKGAQVNHRNFDGNSALHYVEDLSQIEIIKLLVKKGADIHLKNNDGITPAMKAQESLWFDIKRYFQELINAEHHPDHPYSKHHTEPL